MVRVPLYSKKLYSRRQPTTANNTYQLRYTIPWVLTASISWVWGIWSRNLQNGLLLYLSPRHTGFKIQKVLCHQLYFLPRVPLWWTLFYVWIDPSMDSQIMLCWEIFMDIPVELHFVWKAYRWWWFHKGRRCAESCSTIERKCSKIPLKNTYDRYWKKVSSQPSYFVFISGKRVILFVS